EALASALFAHDMPGSRQALALMREEEAGGGGAATVLCSGVKLTKAGAAFVNTETIFAGGMWDTFRMLTHPGTAILPAALAAGETVLEGEAGFYHAYAGNNRGQLRYIFTGDNHADMAAITRDLGREWIFLETLYRIYSTAGYNIGHIAVTAALCGEHAIAAEQ